MLKKLTLILLVLFSCSTNQENESQTNLDRALSFLKEDGFNTKNMTHDSEYIYLENDIMFNIESVLEKIELSKKNRSKQNLSRKHTWYGGKVSSRYRKDITISMASDMKSLWLPALHIAIQRYNEVNRCEIKYRYVSSGARTHITYKDLGPTVAGRGELPNKIWSTSKLRFYRRPGTDIYINPMVNSYTIDSKVDLLLHEMGHTLGFEHTFLSASHKSDYLRDGGSFDGSHISGTAQYGPSVMTPAYSTNGLFTENDIKALSLTYPGPFVSQFNVTINGPEFAIVNQNVTYRVTSRVVEGPRTYRWEVKYANVPYWQYVGNQSTVTFRIPTSATPRGFNAVQVRCTIKDSRNKEGRGTFSTMAEGPTDGGGWL